MSQTNNSNNNKEQNKKRQKKFVQLLFSLSIDNYKSEHLRIKDAMIKAGYSNQTSPYHVLKGLQEEMIEYGMGYSAAHLPRSLQEIVKVMTGKTVIGANTILKAADTLSGYAGIVKQDKLEIKNDGPQPVIVLPSRNKPEDEEYNTTNNDDEDIVVT